MKNATSSKVLLLIQPEMDTFGFQKPSIFLSLSPPAGSMHVPLSHSQDSVQSDWVSDPKARKQPSNTPSLPKTGMQFSDAVTERGSPSGRNAGLSLEVAWESTEDKTTSSLTKVLKNLCTTLKPTCLYQTLQKRAPESGRCMCVSSRGRCWRVRRVGSENVTVHF